MDVYSRFLFIIKQAVLRRQRDPHLAKDTDRAPLTSTRWRFHPHHAHVGDDVAVVQARMADVGEEGAELRAGCVGGGAAADCFFQLGKQGVFVRSTLFDCIGPLDPGARAEVVVRVRNVCD